MRWRAGGAASILLLAACGQESDDRSERVEAGRTDPPAPTVERLSTTVQLAPYPSELQVVGSTVLSFAPRTSAGYPELLRSVDLGETWEPLVLPGASESPSFVHTANGVSDDVAWVTARADDGPLSDFVADLFLWTSRDGLEWTGGLFPTQRANDLVEPTFAVVGDGTLVAGVVTEVGEQGQGVELYYDDSDGRGWVAAELADVVIDGAQTHVDDIWETDGRLIAVIYSDAMQEDDVLTVLESRDDGRSWQEGTCPADSVADDDGCARVVETGRLRVGPQGVSVDGRDWQRPVLDPPPARGDPRAFTFESPLELAGGGWLVAGEVYLNQEESFGVLARSEDGVTWHQLFADDPCLGDDLSPDFRRPVRLTDGWLVVHSCQTGATGSSGDGGQQFAWADLYVLDGAASDVVLVPQTRQTGNEYQQPVTVGEAVLVPITYDDEADRFTDIVRVR